MGARTWQKRLVGPAERDPVPSEEWRTAVSRTRDGWTTSTGDLRSGSPVPRGPATSPVRMTKCSPMSRSRNGRKRRELPGLLIVGEHRDSSGVPLVAREWRSDEGLDEADDVIHRMQADAHRDDPRIVVFAGQPRRVFSPGQRRPNSADLVRRDLLAVAGAAENDAQTLLVASDRVRRPEAEHREVVVLDVLERTVVDHFVPGAAKHGR